MNREILRIAILQVAGVLATTAGLTARSPNPQSFTIEAPAPNPTPSAGGIIIAMARVEVAPEYSGEAFVYQTAEHEFIRDPYARFAAMPSFLLSTAIRGYLANADFISDVVSPDSGLRPKVTVETAALKLVGALRSTDSSSTLTLRFRVLLNPAEVGAGDGDLSRLTHRRYEIDGPQRGRSPVAGIRLWPKSWPSSNRICRLRSSPRGCCRPEPGPAASMTKDGHDWPRMSKRKRRRRVRRVSHGFCPSPNLVPNR